MAATPDQLTGAHLYLDMLAKSGYLFHAVGNVMIELWDRSLFKMAMLGQFLCNSWSFKIFHDDITAVKIDFQYQPDIVHGDPYTGKTTFLYWDGPLVAIWNDCALPVLHDPGNFEISLIGMVIVPRATLLLQL